MILEDAQKFDIITKNPNKDLIAAKRDRSELLRMHCTGDPVLIKKYVQDLPEFMRPGMKETLVQLIRGNVDIIARVMNARDSIYNAKGGIEQYNISESQEPEFRDYLSKVADGLPLKEWIRQKAQRRTDFDPEGLTYMEINESGGPYPVLYPIDSIYDYVVTGRRPEYVIFDIGQAQREQYQAADLLPKSLKKGERVFRVVDDATDCLIIKGRGANGFEIYSELPNVFGYVPGLVNSDIFGVDDNCFESPLTVVCQLLNSYMFGGGTYALAYARQAFPKEWMQLFDCPTCNGDKQINGADCPECGGSGVLSWLKQADVMKVDYRKTGGGQVPVPPAGVITPAVEALQFMAQNVEFIEQQIHLTVWGVAKVQPAISGPKEPAKRPGTNISATAYEAELNEQPKHKRLQLFQRWKDSIYTFVANSCGQILYGQTDIATILGGDRFMIESPDATLQRYLLAVQATAPKAELDSLYIEYIENKYNNNPLLYRKYLLLFFVEPFFHKSDEEVLLFPIPDSQKLEKIYFDEWTSTLTDYDIASVPDDGGAEMLRAQLRQFVQGKYVQGMEGDAQLFGPGGELLGFKEGDDVQIRPGKGKKPEHYGKTFKINKIEGQGVTLSGGGSDGTFGYQLSDVKKPSTKLIETAA